MTLTLADCDRITEYCEKATCGSWSVVSRGPDSESAVPCAITAGAHGVVPGKHCNWDAKPNDLYFIANARQDIPAAIKSLREAYARISVLEMALEKAQAEFNQTHNKYIQSNERVNKLTEALEFYADRFNYRKSGGVRIDQTPIMCDDGDIARTALNSDMKK